MEDRKWPIEIKRRVDVQPEPAEKINEDEWSPSQNKIVHWTFMVLIMRESYSTVRSQGHKEN